MEKEKKETWTPSVLLRWKLVPIDMLSGDVRVERVLQQVWVDDYGNKAWRAIPIEE